MNGLLNLAILAQTAPVAEPTILDGFVEMPFEIVGVVVGIVVAGTLAYFARKATERA